MLLASNLCGLGSHSPYSECWTTWSTSIGSENSERALVSSKLAAFRRCNARASWPTRGGGHLITPFGQLTVRLRNSSCGFWTLRRERLPLLDFACEKNTSAVGPLHFFVGAGNAGETPANEPQASNVFALRARWQARRRRSQQRVTKITQPRWLGDFRLQLEWPWLSDVWTIVDLAGVNERITLGETVQSNVVVFDLGIKRGDFQVQ